MQHNGNAIQLVPPPPLGFPSFQLVHSLAKGIIEDLNKVEAELRQNTGVSLVIKQFEGPSPAQDDSSTITAHPVASNGCLGCKNKKLKNDGRQPDCRHGSGPTYSLHHDIGKSSSPFISNPGIHDSNTNSSGSSNNNVPSLYDTILSQQSRPRPSISQYGHFMGETSYYSSSLSYSPLQQEKMQLDLITRSPFALSTPIQPPHLTLDTQLHLIDVYYAHIHPYLPLINKQDLIQELNHCNNGQPSFLSPLFFYALFARSAPFSTEPHRLCNTNSNNNIRTDYSPPTPNRQTIESFATHCLQYANQLRDTYLHQPRISTVIALLLMAVHLEQSKQHIEFSRIWIWSGEAFRMILDLGLHRYNSFSKVPTPVPPPTVASRTDSSFSSSSSSSSSSSPLTSSSSSSSSSPSLYDPTENAEPTTSALNNSVYEQFGIRTFWAAFVIDRTISLIYGRPFTLEEKDMDVPLPKHLEQDDQETSTWVATFHDLIDISKIMGRIAKFNYSPHASERGPIRHQDAMLSTLDSWITSLLKDFPSREETIALTTQRQHLNTIRRLELYALLILLHRPYITETSAKSSNSSSSSSSTSTTTSNSNASRPSLDICSHTAILITHLISDISADSLIHLSRTSPIVSYATVLALRIHLLNASASTHDQKLGAFGEINFEHTLDILRTIPVAVPMLGRGTMLSESIDTLESQYKQREAPILSGFTRSFANSIKYSSQSSPRISGLLDSRLRFTSTHSDCSTSSFDTDHGGPSTKRPYNMESDYFTSGFSNASTNGSSSSGSTMAKPMQKLKIIEVHPSKGKHKKARSSSTATSNLSNVDSNNNSNNNKLSNHTFINNNNNTGTKNRTNSQLNIVSDDDRRVISPSSPLSVPASLKKSREVSAETGTTVTKTSKAPTGTSQPLTIDHNISNHSSCNDSNTVSLGPTSGNGIVHDQQQHHLYQASNHQYQHQHQHFNDGMHAYRDSSSSSTSSHQSFTPSAGTQGMEYGINTLFTLGDGLTGDHQSSLLYEQFFASANHHSSNPDSNHISTSMHSTTTNMTTSVPIAYDGPAVGSNHSAVPMPADPLLAPSLSPSSSISSSLQFPYYFSSEQTSAAPSNLYIPPSYLPSR